MIWGQRECIDEIRIKERGGDAFVVALSLSRCKMQMQYSEQEYTLRVQRIQDYMIGHVRTARCTGLNLSLSLSQLKKHTLSFYGDYNVASCLPTRSTFGEYITFQGEKSRKKKKKVQVVF